MADIQQDGNEPGADAPEQEADDFAAAFAARVSGKDVEEETGEDTREESSEESSEDAPEGEASEAAGEEPAAKPGSEESDPWADKTPEQLKAEIRRLQHSDQSQRGRISALQRQINARPQPAAEQRSEPKPEDDAARQAREARAERVKSAVEDYPDAVGAIAEELADARKQIEDLVAQVTPIQQQRQVDSWNDYYAGVAEQHPDSKDIIADANFVAWVHDQPKAIQELAVAQDVNAGVKVLTLYKAERAAAMAATETDETGKETPAADKSATDDRRKRQLDGSRSVSSKGPSTSSAVPDDFSAAFKARTEKIKREQAG